jgi:hypothetical protein
MTRYSYEVSFRYPHNHSKLRALWLLLNLRSLGCFTALQLKRGLTLRELSEATGVKYSTLARHLGDWADRYRIVTRAKYETVCWAGSGVEVYHYKLAARGERWVRRWLEYCPARHREQYRAHFQWYAREVHALRALEEQKRKTESIMRGF